jgi:CheY-like chemotaxis protein
MVCLTLYALPKGMFFIGRCGVGFYIRPFFPKEHAGGLIKTQVLKIKPFFQPKTIPEKAPADRQFDLRGASFLLADDDELFQYILGKYLGRWNAQVDFAASGSEAVEKVSRNRYDMVLMDLEMPDLNGFQSSARIRQLPGGAYEELPIIAISIYKFENIRDEIREAGINDWLDKRIDPSSLYTKLLSYL